MNSAEADLSSDFANSRTELQDAVAIVRLSRPAKRNALNDETVFALERWFSQPPEQAKAVVLVGEGEHFCAGLDLSELKERSVAEGVLHSRWWRVSSRVAPDRRRADDGHDADWAYLWCGRRPRDRLVSICRSVGRGSGH